MSEGEKKHLSSQSAGIQLPSVLPWVLLLSLTWSLLIGEFGMPCSERQRNTESSVGHEVSGGMIRALERRGGRSHLRLREGHGQGTGCGWAWKMGSGQMGSLKDGVGHLPSTSTYLLMASLCDEPIKNTGRIYQMRESFSLFLFPCGFGGVIFNILFICF